MESGGRCRKPGPRRRGFFGCDGMLEGSIMSPGRTKIPSSAMCGVGNGRWFECELEDCGNVGRMLWEDCRDIFVSLSTSHSALSLVGGAKLGF